MNTIIIPEKVLESMKTKDIEVYQQMVDFNTRIKPYYAKYDAKVISDAWMSSEPSKENAEGMTLDERFQLFDAKLQEV